MVLLRLVLFRFGFSYGVCGLAFYNIIVLRKMSVLQFQCGNSEILDFISFTVKIHYNGHLISFDFMV